MSRSLLFVLATLALPVAANAQTELALWRLDCGEILIRNIGLFTGDPSGPAEERTLTDSCYLIRHGTDLLLWDTGLPAALIGQPLSPEVMAPSLSVDLPTQLAQIGVTPADITQVGISHIHFDHTAQAASFAQAELVIGAGDWQALQASPAPAWFEGTVVPETLAPWLTGGGKVRPVEGDHDLYGDGSVMMLSMPGHTAGETALLVNLPQTGPVLLSGDVTHFEEQLADRAVPVFNVDPAESVVAMDRLEAVAKEHGATLIIQHDSRHIARLPAFPEAAR